MIASWEPWPILASGYRTRRWATSCVATESLLPPNENTPPAGETSYARIWMFWWERISLRWKCLRSKALVTYYVLFFIQLESRRVCLAGITPHPDQQWMEQMGRNVTMQKWGFLANSRYLLHDRDSKFCHSFRQLIEAGRVKTMPLPARSPNLNAYAERWVRSVKQECLLKLILFGERPLRRALQQYVAHYHEERNHQGKQNRLLFSLPNRGASGDNGIVRCKERLGGLLKYYEREAA